MENNPYKESQSLTTVIAIKCKEGVILASDSLGSTPSLKFNVRKLFNLNPNITLGCAGDGYDIDILIEKLREYMTNPESHIHSDFENTMRSILHVLNKEYNIESSISSGYAIPILLYGVEGLLIRNHNSIDIYHLGFYEHQKGVNSYIHKVNNNFVTIGSGHQIAYVVLSQQERIHNTISGKKLFDLNLDTIIGTALYVLNKVKGFNSSTGGDTQIMVSDKSGFREISVKEHQKYYDVLINDLSDMFDKSFTDPITSKDILRKMFPVEQSTFL